MSPVSNLQIVVEEAQNTIIIIIIIIVIRFGLQVASMEPELYIYYIYSDKHMRFHYLKEAPFSLPQGSRCGQSSWMGVTYT